METIQVHLPNKDYHLYPERNTTSKYGFVFPREIEERTLFVTGLSGTGKTTFVKKICRQENIPYFGQTFIQLNETPFLQRSPDPVLNSLADLPKRKIIDGHFFFPAQNRFGFDYVHNLSSVNYNFSFGEEKNNLLFEFRQLPPTKIFELIEKRHNSPNSSWHTFNPTSIEEIERGENILYETAHKLFEQGADVYIRRGLNGIPWRFSK